MMVIFAQDMEKVERILRFLHPGRVVFTECERSLVTSVLEAECSLAGSGKRVRPASRECPVGGVLVSGGVSYRCVGRPEGTHWSESCSGCDFSRRFRNCDGVRCSCFDRSDGRFVWYVECPGEGSRDGR